MIINIYKNESNDTECGIEGWANREPIVQVHLDQADKIVLDLLLQVRFRVNHTLSYILYMADIGSSAVLYKLWCIARWTNFAHIYYIKYVYDSLENAPIVRIWKMAVLKSRNSPIISEGRVGFHCIMYFSWISLCS